MSEIKTLNGYPLADTKARADIEALSEVVEAQEKQCYSLGTIPIWPDKWANSLTSPFAPFRLHDMMGYGLCAEINGKGLYSINPSTLEFRKLSDIALPNNAVPDIYSMKILPRIGAVYDYVMVYDKNYKKVFRITTTGLTQQTFNEQKLPWLRNTGFGLSLSQYGYLNSGSTMMYAEYWLPDFDEGNTIDKVRVLRSTDFGVTWTSVFEQPNRNGYGTSVFHFHFVQPDPYNTGHWYLGSGDDPSESNIWRSTDDGLTWTKINDPAFSGDAQDIHRACNLYFTEDYIYWGTDDNVPALGNGYTGVWCRSPRNLDTDTLDIEVLADVKDWVRQMIETPYGLLILTEARMHRDSEGKPYSWVWLAPYDDLEHPVLVCKHKANFSGQLAQYSCGSRIFTDATIKGLYGYYNGYNYLTMLELNALSRP